MQILRGIEGAQIKTVTPESIVWISQDGWEHQALGIELNLEEGPDPFQSSLENWIDQERQSESQWKNDLHI
jgi:hypothetical protein